jgi:predicted  nucleic acid-binding Zn-ribbon protein
MIRCWNGSRRVEYVCKGYHNHGKAFCSSHRIREECLDAQVLKHAEALRESWAKEQADLQRLYKQWSLRQPALNQEIAHLREQIRQTEEEIDELLMMRIQTAK